MPPEPADAPFAPSDWQITRRAIAAVTVEPAGLVMQPPNLAVVGIAQLAHATGTHQEHTVNMLGKTVTITLHEKLKTVETTPPFEVKHLHIALTDTAEELQGH